MAGRYVGPTIDHLRGNKRRARQLKGRARVLAGTAIARLRFSNLRQLVCTERQTDGSFIRVKVMKQPKYAPVVAVYITAPALPVPEYEAFMQALLYGFFMFGDDTFGWDKHYFMPVSKLKEFGFFTEDTFTQTLKDPYQDIWVYDYHQSRINGVPNLIVHWSWNGVFAGKYMLANTDSWKPIVEGELRSPVVTAGGFQTYQEDGYLAFKVLVVLFIEDQFELWLADSTERSAQMVKLAVLEEPSVSGNLWFSADLTKLFWGLTQSSLQHESLGFYERPLPPYDPDEDPNDPSTWDYETKPVGVGAATSLARVVVAHADATYASDIDLEMLESNVKAEEEPVTLKPYKYAEFPEPAPVEPETNFDITLPDGSSYVYQNPHTAQFAPDQVDSYQAVPPGLEITFTPTPPPPVDGCDAEPVETTTVFRDDMAEPCLRSQAAYAFTQPFVFLDGFDANREPLYRVSSLIFGGTQEKITGYMQQQQVYLLYHKDLETEECVPWYTTEDGFSVIYRFWDTQYTLRLDGVLVSGLAQSLHSVQSPSASIDGNDYAPVESPISIQGDARIGQVVTKFDGLQLVQHGDSLSFEYTPGEDTNLPEIEFGNSFWELRTVTRSDYSDDSLELLNVPYGTDLQELTSAGMLFDPLSNVLVTDGLWDKQNKFHFVRHVKLHESGGYQTNTSFPVNEGYTMLYHNLYPCVIYQKPNNFRTQFLNGEPSDADKEAWYADEWFVH
jgi:hypothetical protein